MIHRLQAQLGILFSAFVLLVVISVGITYWGLQIQQQDAVVINLAGRQRMLVQQMMRLAQETGEGGSTANSALQEVELTFDQTLRALLDGGAAPYLSNVNITLPVTRDPRIRSALNETTLSWNATRALLDELQQTPPTDPSFNSLLASFDQKSSALVEQTDEMVRLFEANSTAKINRLRIMQIGFFIAALALLGAGVYITRRSALEPLRDLTRAANRLGENDLDSELLVEGPEEMQKLAESFDLMRQSLRASRSKLLELMSTLEERVDQRTRELDALNEVSREIASRLELREVLKSVTEKARFLLKSDSAMLCLLGESNQYLSLQATSGLPMISANGQFTSTVNQASAVLSSRRALVCSDAQCVGGCKLISNIQTASHVVAPLRIGEKVIGTLCASSSQSGYFTNESADLLTKLANTAAVAMQNAQLYEQAERVAVLEERQRVAAEMHDGLGQTLGYLGLMTDRTMEFLSHGQNEDALERLKKTRETIENATSEVRRAIDNLMDESPPSFDLRARLRGVVDEFSKENDLAVNWQVEMKSAPDCSRQVAEQVLNVTREALKNVAHHALAERVDVRVGESDGRYFIAVEDNGRGFDVSQPEPNGHFGLKIMQARAAHIGGQVKLESAPGCGTRVTLTWAKEAGN